MKDKEIPLAPNTDDPVVIVRMERIPDGFGSHFILDPSSFILPLLAA